MSDQGNMPQELNVPLIHATIFSVAASGVDLKVTLSDGIPEDTDPSNKKAKKVNLGVLAMSLHSAKDLSVLLCDAIQTIEESQGKIETPFTLKRAEEKT